MFADVNREKERKSLCCVRVHRQEIKHLWLEKKKRLAQAFVKFVFCKI